MELSTGHSYQREPTPSGLVAKATCWGSGRSCISSERKNRLDALRFKEPRVHPAQEAHLQDIYKPKPFVPGNVKIPASMGDLVMNGSGGSGEDRGKDSCGHESPQTDYGSTTMFDDDEAWFHDQDGQDYNVLGLIPGSDYIGEVGAPDLFGQAAASGSWLEPYPGGSGEKITLLVDMEGVLDQSPDYAFEYLDDEPYGCSDDTPSVFGKAPDPLVLSTGATNGVITSGPCEHSHSLYDSTLKQLSPPFTEEGFSGERIPSTSGHPANSVKCRHLEPAKISSGGVIVVRCQAADVVRNGKIRWIDVSGPAHRVQKSTPAWPLYPDINGITEPIERPPFPADVRERSPIHGLSADRTVKTCFHIKDAVEVATLVAKAKMKGDVLVELFAKVLQNRTMDGGTRQKFQFCDIFLVGPPLLPGEYAVPKRCGPWDTKSRVFMGTAMVRLVGRMKKRNSAREWMLKIENIRDADWGDVDWVRGVVCGNGEN
ncbi:hypothetical protein HOY80DRAFT_938546 [Tuber brumale]|nr:hypothetical protein HOY80DRAFT_938546 [Tuber brumale]